VPTVDNLTTLMGLRACPGRTGVAVSVYIFQGVKICFSFSWKGTGRNVKRGKILFSLSAQLDMYWDRYMTPFVLILDRRWSCVVNHTPRTLYHWENYPPVPMELVVGFVPEPFWIFWLFCVLCNYAYKSRLTNQCVASLV
jgi:hypothetical protein